jgi:hypothetical protein
MLTRFLFSFCLIPFSSQAFAQSVKAGVWQAVSTINISGLPLPGSKDEECISASEAKDIKATILKRLEKTGCSSTKWIVKGAQLDIGLKCKRAGLDAEGNLHGTVTRTLYKLSGTASGTYQSIPTEAELSLQGQWIKDCKN